MPYPNAQLENQLRTCSMKVKISLPNTLRRRKRFPYALVAKGRRGKNNTFWIDMQMYKSQHENPIKSYHWKRYTDVMDAITYLAHSFICEYGIH